MISPVSSAKIKPTRHAFSIALREGTVPGILGTLLMALTIIGPIFSYFSRAYQGDPVAYVYGDPNTYFAYPILAALFGFTQALFSFRLLANRSASSVYFGLGVSRQQVFDARFAAGALWLTAAVVLTMGTGAVVNLCNSNYTGLILSRALYLGAGLWVTAFIAYAATALVCARVGTLAEAITYSLLALLLPTLLIFGLGNQMHAFLRGFPYGYDTRYSGIQSFDLPASLTSVFTSLNPLLFFKPAFAKYALYFPGQTYHSTGADALSWGPLLGWLVAAVVLAALARRFFTTRRVENTGLLGTCRPLAIAVIAPTVWASASALLFKVDDYGNWPLSVILVVGVVLAAAVTAASYFPLRVVERGAWRGLWAFPAVLAATGLCMGLLATGALGYSSFVPDAGSVASVQITYKGLPGLVPSLSYNSPYVPSYENNDQITLTDPGDVALACKLHRALASDGYDKGISNYTLVKYTLKDGRTVTRFYRTATTQTLQAMLALDDTGAYLNTVASTFENPVADPDLQVNIHASVFTSNTVYLAGPLSTQATRLDEGTLAKVREALAEDLTNQPSHERYFPANLETCTLIFITDRWGPTTYFPESAKVVDLGDMGTMATISLDAAYPRTLAVLTDSLATIQSSDIEWVRLGPNYGDVLAKHTLNPNVSPFFMGLVGSQTNVDYYIGEAISYAGTPSPAITNTGRINELYTASRNFSFAAGGGQLLFVKLKGVDEVTIRYIPAS